MVHCPFVMNRHGIQMKNFVFSLERMRGYKEQVLDKEKNNLAQLQQRRNKITDQIDQLKIYCELKNIELQEKQRLGMDASELNAYRFFKENVRLQLEDLAQELQKADNEVERQRQIVVSVSREVAGLDKLEERQLEEYHVLETRDFNLQIQEHVVTDLVRKGKNPA